jgi:hypothetical protein
MLEATTGEHQAFDLYQCFVEGPVRLEPFFLVRKRARSDLDSRHRKAPNMRFERVDRRGVCPGQIQVDLRGSHEQPLVLPQFRHL